MEDNSYAPENGNWKRLWRIRVPPKVRNFLWRVAHNCLPTRDNLGRRGIQVPDECVICGLNFENSWHSLINCSFAEACWHEVGLHEVIYSVAWESDSVVEWLFKIIDKLHEPDIDKFAMVAWAIWKQRNNQLWNSTHLSAANTVFSGLNALYEWISVKFQPSNTAVSSRKSHICELWHPPPATFVKCNVDAAFPAGVGVTGFGMVLRDDAGAFLACRSAVFNGCLPVAEGEAMSFLEALSWVRNLGFQKVVFELDSKCVVDATGSGVHGMTELDMIIAKCKQIMAGNPEFKVRFTRRKANDVAHAVARNAHCSSSPCVWVEAPSYVAALLNSFCTHLDHISIIA